MTVRKQLPLLISLTLANLLLISSVVQANDVCKTPDGYVFPGFKPTGGLGGTGHEDRQNGTGGIGGTGHEGQKTGTGGIGGTGKQASNGGLGGTGNKLTEGGLGGTGKPLSIGVYGRITGFGSVCVNGMEIHYKDNTPVQIDSRRADINDLKVGQIVSLTAHVNDRGDLYTRDIAVHSLLTGPVDHIDHKTQTIHALGQVIKAGAITSKLHVGDAVRVSGLRDGAHRVVATLVEKVPASTPSSISGTVRIDQGVARIGTTPINSARTPRDGTFVQVKGNWDGQKFTANSIAPKANPANPQGVSHFSIQTFKGQAGISGGKDQRIILFGTSNGKGSFKQEKVIEERGSIRPNIVGGHSGKDDRGADGKSGSDRSGHGSSHAAHENGSGSGNDTEQERSEDRTDDNSGHGNGDDTGDDSHSGNDDNSGSDNSGDDNSGSDNSGSDDQDIDNSGHGSDHDTDSIDTDNEGSSPDDVSPEAGEPEVDEPEVDEPETEAPEVEEPEVEEPEVEAPEVEEPEVETPEVETPEIETPEIDEPEIEAPEIEEPEIDEPDIDEPELD